MNVINELPASIADELEQIMNAALGTVFPAAQIAVYTGDQWRLNRAWGWIDPETQTHPCTVDTHFDLASLTKLFTTNAFLTWMHHHGFSLDDPLEMLIPEFSASGERPVGGGVDPHTKAPLPILEGMQGKTVNPSHVTFRHLLTHTSGLPAWLPVYQAAGDPPPPPGEIDPLSREERWRRALAYLVNTPFVNEPGVEVRYSDIGLMLLGEALSRMTYGDDLATSIVVAAGMGLDFGFLTEAVSDEKRWTITPTELDSGWRKRRVWGEVHDENACGVGKVAGHAGLFAPAHKVALLGIRWLKSAEMLTPHLHRQATREHARTGDERRGLGWMIKSPVNSSAGERFSPDSYGHTGFTGTSLWIDPERELVVALLTNRVYYGRERVGIHDVRRAVHDCLAKLADS